MTVSTLYIPNIVQRDDAVELLRQYLGCHEPRATPYTGASFETLAGAGDRLETRDRFTAEDMVAVSMLGVQVPATASLQILDERVEEFYELLKQIPATAELVSADDSVINESSPAWKLWQKLYDLGGVGSTIASKLLARKRPMLLPIYDQVVRATLQRPKPDLTFWSDLRDALRADDRALYVRLSEIRDQVKPAQHLSIIRVFDIVIWMHGRAHTQAAVVTEGSLQYQQGQREFEGEFWIAGQDNARQPGFLHVAPKAAPRVEAVGGLLSPWRERSRTPLPDGGMAIKSSFSEEALTAPVTIYGLDRHGTPMTLLEARTVHWGSRGHHLQGIRALVGGHVRDRDHQFTGFRLRLWPLDAWRPRLHEATWPAEVQLAGDGILSIEDLPHSSGTSESTLWLTGRRLYPFTLRGLDRRFLRPLMTFFTLATDTPCGLLTLQVQEQSPDGPWWDVYSSALHPESDKFMPWEQARWLLQPTDLDLHHVCSWVDRVEVLGPLPPVVADLAHARPISLETQVQLLCTVAEGLHRRLYPEEVRFDEDTANAVKAAAVEAVRSIHTDATSAVQGFLSHVEEVGYGKRLVRLADVVKAAAPGITGRTSKWKNLVYTARNEFAHRPVERNFLDDEDIEHYSKVFIIG